MTKMSHLKKNSQKIEYVQKTDDFMSIGVYVRTYHGTTQASYDVLSSSLSSLSLSLQSLMVADSGSLGL